VVRQSTNTIDFTFTFNSEVGKVRSYNLPVEYDEKGNFKKFNKEELAALKGDDPAEKKMEGFKSELADVVVGDNVRVVLSAFRTNPKKPAAPAKEEKDEKDLPDEGKEKKDGRWVPASVLIGQVTKVPNADSTGESPTFTIRVVLTKRELAIATRGGAGTDMKSAQTVDPETAQATAILIGVRAQPTALAEATPKAADAPK
jgi:hypothetical protein